MIRPILDLLIGRPVPVGRNAAMREMLARAERQRLVVDTGEVESTTLQQAEAELAGGETD